MKKLLVFILLHFCILFYSVGGVLAKIAAKYPMFSVGFFCCYFGILAILVIYAVLWQQILKHMQLTVAYANKAMTVIWGIIWGMLFFCEKISIQGFIGTILIVIGICMLAFEESET